MLKNQLQKNTTMLYIMTIAKVVFPFITLPYLTRVLSVESYATVAYVKATLTYMQMFVDFGFLLSSTKEIVAARNEDNKVNDILSNTVVAKLFLSACGFFITIVMCMSMSILRQNVVYTLLSMVTVAVSSFLVDFFFRGIEEMQVIAMRFFITKGVSTVLTFAIVHSDSDLLWIPILDIFSSILSAIWIWHKVKSYGYHLCKVKLKRVAATLKTSAQYFISNMATTTFNALNTILIGIFVSQVEVAYWSVALQVVGAIQSFYTPITDGLYPEMIRTKNLKLIKKILFIFMPLIVIGCIVVYRLADVAMLIVGGEKYLEAAPVLQTLIPVLLFSFPAMLLGWPTLGSINKIKETTKTTVVTAVLQVIGLIVLIIGNQFTIINVAILRGITEGVMMLLRAQYCWRFRHKFSRDEF